MFESPTFWVGVAFFIFVFLVWKPIRRFLLQGLDARGDRIRSEVETAIALREEAQAALSQYQRKQREALSEAEDILNRARAEAKRIADDALKDVETLLKTRSELALKNIKVAEGKALEEVQQHTVAIIHTAVHETLRGEVRGKLADGLLDSALKDIQQKLH